MRKLLLSSTVGEQIWGNSRKRDEIGMNSDAGVVRSGSSNRTGWITDATAPSFFSLIRDSIRAIVLETRRAMEFHCAIERGES
jgi:hypothetical protein